MQVHQFPVNYQHVPGPTIDDSMMNPWNPSFARHNTLQSKFRKTGFKTRLQSHVQNKRLKVKKVRVWTGNRSEFWMNDDEPGVSLDSRIQTDLFDSSILTQCNSAKPFDPPQCGQNLSICWTRWPHIWQNRWLMDGAHFNHVKLDSRMERMMVTWLWQSTCSSCCRAGPKTEQTLCIQSKPQSPCCLQHHLHLNT